MIRWFIYTPGTCLSSIFGFQPSKTRPFPIKTRVIWVPGIHIHSLKLTAKAPENCPGPKRQGQYSNHTFSGALASSFREGVYIYIYLSVCVCVFSINWWTPDFSTIKFGVQQLLAGHQPMPRQKRLLPATSCAWVPPMAVRSCLVENDEAIRWPLENWITLPKSNIAIENPPFWWYLQGNKGIFMGYVSFREGSALDRRCANASVHRRIKKVQAVRRIKLRPLELDHLRFRQAPSCQGKKMVSRDSWMYPYQRIRIGNPYISNTYHMGTLLGVQPIVLTIGALTIFSTWAWRWAMVSGAYHAHSFLETCQM